MTIINSLPPSNLNFSTELLRAPQLAQDISVHNHYTVYLEKEHGSLECFENSAAFTTLLAEFQEHSQQITQWLNEDKDKDGKLLPSSLKAKEAFKKFFERIQKTEHEYETENEGGFGVADRKILYSTGKRHLDLFCDMLKNEASPLTKKLQALWNLSTGICVCGPGIVTNLVNSAIELRSSLGDSKAKLHGLIQKTIEQSIQDFVRTNHKDDPDLANNEIHFLSSYQTALANKLGIPQPDWDRYKESIPEYQLKECEFAVMKQLTPSHLALSLANDFLEEIKMLSLENAIPLNQALSEQQLKLFNQALNTFEGIFSQKITPIDRHSFLIEENGHYSISDNPVLVARTILEHWAQEKYFRESIDIARPLYIIKSDEQHIRYEQCDQLVWRSEQSYFEVPHGSASTCLTSIALTPKDYGLINLNDSQMIDNAPNDANFSSLDLFQIRLEGLFNTFKKNHLSKAENYFSKHQHWFAERGFESLQELLSIRIDPSIFIKKIDSLFQHGMSLKRMWCFQQGMSLR